MLSFPCFSKYLESFLDVRTYSIVFPRKIVVPRVIPFPRVIASPSLMVKKKLIQSTPSSYTHWHSHTVHLVQSVKKKKKSRLLLPTQTPGRWSRSRLTDLWALWINSKKLSGSSRLLFLKAPKQKKKWDCSLSNLASFRMRMFSLFDVTFSWRTASYKKNLK